MVRMEKEEKPCRLYPSVRLMMFLLVLLGCTMLGGGFAAFNFAIVCMTNETAVDEGQQSGWNQSRCGLSAGVSEEEVLTKKGYDGEFNWDRSVQASLLAAHSIGAIFVNVPAGLFSDRYGSKWIFGVSVLMSGIASALTPVAAYAGVPWLFATRILEGIGAGMAWPPVLAMVSRWGTPDETGILVTLGATGYQVGPLIAMATSGMICDSRLRWPYIFYIWAAMCGLFVLLWFLIYTDDPKKCRFISEKELAYVEKHRMRKNTESKQSLWNVPWKAIFTSPCVLATYVCQFCATWGNFWISVFMPMYSKEVLLFDVNSNGFFSALPSLMMVVVRVFIGPTADRITFGGRSKTFSVKVFSAIQAFGPCICYLVLSFLDCRTSALAVAVLCLCSSCLSLSVVGYLKGGVLIAARYAGLIGSVGNVAAYVAGVVMPYATGAMVKHQSLAEWKATIYLAAGVMAVSGVQYQIFGSAKEQPWANESKKPSHKVFTVSEKAMDALPDPASVKANGDKEAA